MSDCELRASDLWATLEQLESNLQATLEQLMSNTGVTRMLDMHVYMSGFQVNGD